MDNTEQNTLYLLVECSCPGVSIVRLGQGKRERERDVERRAKNENDR